MAVLIEPRATIVPSEIGELPSILYNTWTSAVTAFILNEKTTLLEGLFGVVKVKVKGACGMSSISCKATIPFFVNTTFM